MMNNSDKCGFIDDEEIVLLHKFPFLRGVLLHKNNLTRKGVEALSRGNFSSMVRLDLG